MQTSKLVLGKHLHRVEEQREGTGRTGSGPHDDIGGGEVVEQPWSFRLTATSCLLCQRCMQARTYNIWRVEGDVEDAASFVIRLLEGNVANVQTARFLKHFDICQRVVAASKQHH